MSSLFKKISILLTTAGLSACGAGIQVTAATDAATEDDVPVTYGSFSDLEGSWNSGCIVHPASGGTAWISAEIELNNGSGSTEISIYGDSTCSSGARMMKAKYVFSYVEGSGALPEGGIALDSTVVETLQTYFGSLAADGTSDCVGQGDVTFVDGVEQDIAGMCGEDAAGLVSYGTLAVVTSTTPYTLLLGDSDNYAGEDESSANNRPQHYMDWLPLSFDE